jgi:hypothetical protein
MGEVEGKSNEDGKWEKRREMEVGRDEVIRRKMRSEVQKRHGRRKANWEARGEEYSN